MQKLWNRIRRATGRASAPRGMTLVEIMIVITIMASIMGVVAYSVFGTMNQAKTKQARIGIDKLRGIVESYYLMNTPNQLPDNLEELTQGQDPLVEDTSKIKDPWGNKYIYEKKGNQDFVIFSAGPDGSRGTQDDVRKDSE